MQGKDNILDRVTPVHHNGGPGSVQSLRDEVLTPCSPYPGLDE